MCGFIGQISNQPFDNDRLLKANKLIECRGPDEFSNFCGHFYDLYSNDDPLHFSFIFNRLSIVDLGLNSSQPMVSKEFKTSIMFNGEIYNHQQLRKEMVNDDIKFYSDHSDTEVVLNGLSAYGLDFLDKMIGQFSIVFHDSKKSQLYLIRDRLGQKPLFFKHDSNSIKFSSNLKSLIKLDSKFVVNKNSMSEYLKYNVVTAPNTIFEDTYKIEPGQYIIFDLKDKITKVKTKKYWKLDKFIGNDKFEEDKFFDLFRDAIKLRQIADVPLANFLSGGIDSTAIVKSLYDNNANINTFSIGFENQKYDESEYSREVSKKYKTNHSEKIMNINNLQTLVEESILAFDEPYCDPSTVPSFLIAKEMSKQYKTSISGDGGDELLGGYKRVNQTLKKRNKLLTLLTLINKIYPNYFGTGNKFMKYSSNKIKAYESYLGDENFLKILNLKARNLFEEKYFTKDFDLYKNLMLYEYRFYLSEMMMLKIDRTSMANSLEVRSPFVDHRLVEYILGTEPSYLEPSRPKKILKDYLKSDFDDYFLNRKKMGFVFELEDWIYNNENQVKKTILNNLSDISISPTKLKLLFIFKTRINAIRIWKLYFIEKYLESLY